MKPYEKTALKEIHDWKNDEVGFFAKALSVVQAPVDIAGDLLLKTPAIGWAIRKSITGIVDIINDVAAGSVFQSLVFEDFKRKPERLTDIHELDLEEVDEAIGYLAAKYKALAATTGVASGTLGGPGIAVDIVAVIALNLRAVNEYATYCGFDVTKQEERLFALNVLGLASSPSDASKSVAMAQLVKLAVQVAQKKTWAELNKNIFVKIIQQIAKALAIRLTKAKLAQVIPVVGGAIGGGYNVYYTSKVCNAAYYLYRERFLAEKYGAEVIEITVPPAAPDDFDIGE